MIRVFATIFLAIVIILYIVTGAMVILTFSQAFAEVRCTYRTVTEQHTNGTISTTQKRTCIERTIDGESAPTEIHRSKPLTELEKKIRKPGCYKKDPDGYIVADPQCPAWIAYLREIDERNGLVPYSTRKHNRFKRDLFGAVLTVIFSR